MNVKEILMDNFIKYLEEIKIAASPQPGFFSLSTNPPFTNVDEKQITAPKGAPLFVLFPVTDTYSSENFLADLKEQLVARGHLYSDHIAANILVFYQMLRLTELRMNSKQLWMHTMATCWTSCEVHQVYPMHLEVDANFQPIRLKTIEICRFDSARLKKEIEDNTKSDFHKRNWLDLEDNKALLSFRRQTISFQLFNYERLIRKFGLADVERVLASYFDALAFELGKQFWNDFEQEQEISVAMGAAFYDPKIYKDYGLGSGVLVTVFSRVKNKLGGWVVPIKTYVESLSYSSQLAGDKVSELVSFYNESCDELTGFSYVLGLLVKGVAGANKALFDNKVDEAFLSFWITLDTILNDDDLEARSNLLKNRIAALIWYPKGTKHTAEYFRISELYTKRSAYVHAGESITRSEAIEMQNICQIIYNIVLTMHVRAINVRNVSLAQWYESIDELASVGRLPTRISKELLNEVGLIERNA